MGERWGTWGQAEAAAEGVPSPPRDLVDSKLRRGHPNPLSWCHIFYAWLAAYAGRQDSLTVPIPCRATDGACCKRELSTLPWGSQGTRLRRHLSDGATYPRLQLVFRAHNKHFSCRGQKRHKKDHFFFFSWSKLASLRGTSSGFAIEKDGVTEQNSGVGTSKAGRTTVASDSPQPRRQGS